jgi:uncharacterized protein YndB with AHSA1/START domain
MRSMDVKAQAVVVVPRPPAAVFRFCVDPTTMAQVFKGAGPIPAITQVTGPAPAVGVIRKIHQADGSVLEEEVLELDPPRRHAYRIVRGIKAPFSLLVRWGDGAWTFTPESEGTRIQWDYGFRLTSPLVWPVARPLMIFMRRAMQGCLDQIKEQMP